MSEDTPFVGAPADSREAIMRATYEALNRHGSAGLSIQRIADAAGLSKSTVYHHYEDKEDLLTSFVTFTLEEFVRLFSLEAGEDPHANLRTFVELIVAADPAVDRPLPDERGQILESYVELRALAIRNEAIRERFAETDRTFVDQVEAIVREGIARGTFRPVDPTATATFLVTVIAGTIFRVRTRPDDTPTAVIDEIDAYLEARLLA